VGLEIADSGQPVDSFIRGGLQQRLRDRAQLQGPPTYQRVLDFGAAPGWCQ
jgi:hypothetical protein